MTHKTKGIVLRNIKYGETSVIVSVFTELFGLQTYLINGVRQKQSKQSKIALFQPSAILELEVYHNDKKKIQRIKEANWSYVPKNLLSDVLKNCIASYMIELMQHCIKQPESHPELFYFCEDAFMALDEAENGGTANFALFFCLQFPQFFGFQFPQSPSSIAIDEKEIFLDLAEGIFLNERPSHSNYMDMPSTLITIELLKVMHPSELREIKLNRETRKKLLQSYQLYYRLHLPEFGVLKTTAILEAILN